MKLIDKLKNVFFEEVEEDSDEEELPQTFAKKVEIPKKKVEVVTPNFNQEKKEEGIFVEDKNESFEIEPKEVKIIEDEKDKEKEFPMMFDDDDFLEDKPSFDESLKRETRIKHDYNEERELYQGKKEVSYVESVNNKPTYSYTKSYYEEKETKGFKPSPIISPIYGILDKNYHKEEVITKKETRITSTYNKPDLDSIRNKAFGGDDKEIVEKTKKNDNISEKNEKRIYDVNNNKPQVNRVTLADADEYYNDLGLAYNVDYSDASIKESRTSKYNKDKKKNKSNVDDNLFDLIDSMYNRED